MTHKDKEAFENWFENNWQDSDDKDLFTEAWQSACDYKQKEIDELKNQDQIIAKEIKTYIDIANRLQAENAELKQKLSTVWEEAEKFYLDD